MADFFIGEALQGKGNELAHVDLMIGDKDGPVGHAFANGMTQLSQGHTPLLALIKPNLVPHPRTLIVPKVTINSLDQAAKIFGPAQMAVAKAVADAAEEGDIPPGKIFEYVVIVSVYIHPKAEDESKIYYYNYGATRLAIKRALSNYPSMKKLIAEKDRAKHPVMTFRPQTLWDPPYLQVALDVGSLSAAVKIVEELPKSDRIIIEIGTPYIKKYGIEETIGRMRVLKPGAYIIADMKTMDVGRAEVEAAADATANAVVVSGIAPAETIAEFIRACNKRGVHAWVDSLNTNQAELLATLQGLKEKPKVVILHRGIDQEDAQKEGGTKKEGTSASRSVWGDIKQIKKITGGLAAVAGGLKPGQPLADALKAGADIVIVGRYIYRSSDPNRAAMRFLDEMEIEADTMRLFDKLDY
ncbi:MAG: bifunctional 5,6,7,8-tetrahydromethanopterin hydro-lyase/3-hexulose-6-phosphate synthase [Candidatus Heimdallarchaeota archaeon]|nr:bifunctional 5,6,7,8-tetrahydromethanopterin hydro-lyase/3-hexulose-6-phosphate synthase [Candidatus Heimdallarchaeota archaeon]MBY8995410.1 bifunctional 5,6,7,8-tetrahydromethanopterin hydro-lyase/3-hexulose-6-phosphate synthase [Candidatus Heimdallarchaeota archaeon]